MTELTGSGADDDISSGILPFGVLNVVGSRFRQSPLVKDYLEKRSAAPPAHDIVYHYTTASTLRNIIETGTIWTTPAPFLNDEREFKHGYDVYQKTIARLLSASKDNDFCKGVEQIGYFLERSAVGTAAWITCFSENPDQLSQWRGYAADGTGYSIGFDANDLQTLSPKPSSFSVIYDEKSQQEMCETFVNAAILMSRELAEEYKDQLPGYKLEGATFVAMDQQEAWISIITNFIRGTCAALKDPGFAEENEFRLVLDAGPVSHLDLQYHDRKGVLVPHIPLKWPYGDIDGKARLPIKRIVTGPNLRPATDAKWALERFLEQHGYVGDNKVTVDHSEIPYLS
jgi:hypothetical protein